MRFSLRIGGALLSCLSSFAYAGQSVPSGTATPVQPAPQSAPSGTVFTPSAAGDAGAGSEVSRISLDVRVAEQSGKLVSGLAAEDFTVLDNGKPAKIRSYRAYSKSDLPMQVQVLLVFDALNTDFYVVSEMRQQVSTFLRRNGGHLTTPVTVYWLTYNGLERQGPPSLDGNALAAQVDASAVRLPPRMRAQGAFGAIERYNFCVNTLSKLVQALASTPGRKMLIWAGPGWPAPIGPNIDISGREAPGLFGEIVYLSAQLRAKQIVLYSISGGMADQGTFLYQGYVKGVQKPSQVQLQDLSLKVLAVQSGGLALAPSNDIAASLDTCYHDAGAFYSLSFGPAPSDSRSPFHKIEVRIDKPGLTARTRTGYYDQSAGQ